MTDSRDDVLERARALIGTVIDARQTVVVEPAAVAAFNLAVTGSTHPAYGVSSSEFAPPAFLYHLVQRPFDVTSDERPRPLVDLPLGSPINGGIEFEFVRPVRVGESLTVETVLHEVDLRKATAGFLIVAVARTSVTDPGSREVASYRHTMLYRRQEDA